MRKIGFIIAFSLLPATATWAEPVTINTASGKIVIGPEQQLMLDASKKVLEKDYAGALTLYDQVIGINGANIQAYIQRGVVKREMRDLNGSRLDGAMAVRLAEAGLQRDPQNARLYYQRGTAFRLLRDFAKARENIKYAIQLTGGKRADWASDLRAIDLEEKMPQ